MGLRSRILLAFVVGAAWALAGVAALLWTSSQARSHALLVDQSADVRLAAEKLLGALRDAETGQRGFLLTEAPRYLAPYRAGVAETASQLQTLRARVAGFERQQQRVQQLETLANEKLAELDQTVRLAEQGRRDEALVIVTSHRGDQLMRQLRRGIEELDREERVRLRDAEADQKRLVQQGQALAVVWILVAALVFGTLTLLVQRHLIGPLASLTRASSAVGAGDFSSPLPQTGVPDLDQLMQAFRAMQADLAPC